jgi:hypothetical protein
MLILMLFPFALLLKGDDIEEVVVVVPLLRKESQKEETRIG